LKEVPSGSPDRGVSTVRGETRSGPRKAKRSYFSESGTVCGKSFKPEHERQRAERDCAAKRGKRRRVLFF